MCRAVSFDAAADVVQICELAAAVAARHLTKVRVERHVLDVVLLEVSRIVGFQRQAVDAGRVVPDMLAPDE